MSFEKSGKASTPKAFCETFWKDYMELSRLWRWKKHVYGQTSQVANYLCLSVPTALQENNPTNFVETGSSHADCPMMEQKV
jgi:hypothetical protein